MPDKDMSSIKNEKLYEKLRDEGNSKEKAARIANAAASEGESTVAGRGGESGSYENWTVDDLRDRAGELGLTDYSDKSKDELIEALRNH